MKFSTKSRYALRLMAELARYAPGTTVSLKEISERQNLSLKYLEQIVTPLARVGLVKSERGVIGVGLCLLLLIPGNMLIHSIADSASVTAALPLQAALVLIALATLLTILGGLIPAKSASKCDPVKALRSE